MLHSNIGLRKDSNFTATNFLCIFWGFDVTSQNKEVLNYKVKRKRHMVFKIFTIKSLKCGLHLYLASKRIP